VLETLMYADRINFKSSSTQKVNCCLYFVQKHMCICLEIMTNLTPFLNVFLHSYTEE